jgi:hypothetical protein
MLLAPVSPYHQQGSTMPSAAPAAYSSCHLVPFASMGGESPHTRPHDCSYGSMAPLSATTEAATPSPSLACPFLPTRSFPTHPLPTMGGSAALAACCALECSHQHLASTMSKHPGFADANPWVMEEINVVARELQCWYQRHSIRWYLARQTRQHLAATTIQCWKRRIWLDRWFAQQALQHQKCICLQLLCHGALAYAVSVWGDCRPPPTPTNKTSDPKVLRHPFWDPGLLLPRRRRVRQTNCPCCRPGQRHQPRAPDSGDSGGGSSCMPMAFWAAQTRAALDLLGVWQDYPHFKSYLTPHAAATRIQKAYRLHVIGRHCCILPSLCGPCKSQPACPIISDGYATAQNACYRSMLIDMYMDWSGFDFQELILYLEILRSTKISMWPSSSDDDVRRREYSVQDVIIDEQWAAAVGI